MIDKFMDWFFDISFKAYEMIRDGCIIIIVFAFLVITLPIWILPFIFWLFFVWEKKDTDVSKQTNADRIRTMGDEELIKIIMCPYDTAGKPIEIMPCVSDGNVQKLVRPEDCKKCMMKWLQSEVEE